MFSALSTSCADEVEKIAAAAEEQAVPQHQYELDTLAHEIGHHKINKSLGRVANVPRVAAQVERRLGTVMQVVPLLRWAVEADSGRGHSTSTRDFDSIATLGAAMRTLSHVPRLAEEGAASLYALKTMSPELSPEERSEARKALGTAFGTYTVAPAVDAAGTLMSAAALASDEPFVRAAVPAATLAGGWLAKKMIHRAVGDAVTEGMAHSIKRSEKEIRDYHKKNAPEIDLYLGRSPLSIGGAFIHNTKNEDVRRAVEEEIDRNPTFDFTGDEKQKILRRGGIYLGTAFDNTTAQYFNLLRNGYSKDEALKRVAELKSKGKL